MPLVAAATLFICLKVHYGRVWNIELPWKPKQPTTFTYISSWEEYFLFTSVLISFNVCSITFLIISPQHTNTHSMHEKEDHKNPIDRLNYCIFYETHTATYFGFILSAFVYVSFFFPFKYTSYLILLSNTEDTWYTALHSHVLDINKKAKCRSIFSEFIDYYTIS